MDEKRIAEIDREIRQLEMERKIIIKCDSRVNFGQSVTFTTTADSKAGAYIGESVARPGDKGKVLIAAPGFRWIYFDRYNEATAVMLVRTMAELTGKAL
jgi:hypothetical protein